MNREGFMRDFKFSMNLLILYANFNLIIYFNLNISQLHGISPTLILVFFDCKKKQQPAEHPWNSLVLTLKLVEISHEQTSPSSSKKPNTVIWYFEKLPSWREMLSSASNHRYFSWNLISQFLLHRNKLSLLYPHIFPILCTTFLLLHFFLHSLLMPIQVQLRKCLSMWKYLRCETIRTQSREWSMQQEKIEIHENWTSDDC